MEPAQIRAKLEQACGAGGHALSDHHADARRWEISLGRDSSRRVAVTHDSQMSLVSFARVLAVPPAPDLSHLGPEGPPSYRQLLLSTAAKGLMVKAETTAGDRELTLTLPVHEDGFTVQEILRSLTALDRAQTDVAAAVEGFTSMLARSGAVNQALERASQYQLDMERMSKEIDALAGEGAPAVAPAETRCQNCARTIPPGVKFCTGCGRSVPGR